MSQIKIYGLKQHLDPIKSHLSEVIHECVMEVLQLPIDKRAHRFFGLDVDDFYRPATATEKYIILEIAMMEGRATETKKRLIRTLFSNIKEKVGLENFDVEIQIIESPKHNWGFRGQCGDEIGLNYRVEV